MDELTAARAGVLRERKREMARKTSRRRGAAIIALIAAIAALAGGPSAASVALSNSYDFGIEASWAEE